MKHPWLVAPLFSSLNVLPHQYIYTVTGTAAFRTGKLIGYSTRNESSLQNNPIVKTRAWQPNPQSAPAVPPSPLLPLLITRHLRKDEEFTMLKEESKSSAKPLYTQLLQGAGLNKHTQPGAAFQLAWTQGNGT